MWLVDQGGWVNSFTDQPFPAGLQRHPPRFIAAYNNVFTF